MAQRLIIDDGRARREIPLSEGTLRVGRGAQHNDLRLEERNVSRQHARFRCQDGTVEVEDLGSRCGTYVNDQRLGGSRRLFPGDRVRIGDFELELEPAAAEGPSPAGAGAQPPPLPNRFTPRPQPPGEPAEASPLRRVADAAARAVEAAVDRITRR